MSKQQMPPTKSFTLSNTSGLEELCGCHATNSWKRMRCEARTISLRVDVEKQRAHPDRSGGPLSKQKDECRKWELEPPPPCGLPPPPLPCGAPPPLLPRFPPPPPPRLLLPPPPL